MLSPKSPIFSVLILVVFFCTTGGGNFTAIAQSGSFSFEYLQEKFPEMDAYMDQVAMDPWGFVWLGSEIQIQRYDGYQIKTYPIRSGLEESGEKLSRDAAPGFLTDSYGNFWVFSNIGLFLYQPVFDNFTRVNFKPPVDFFYPNSKERPDVFVITAFMEDSQQNLWVGLEGGVLFYFPLSFLEDLKQKNGFLAESVWLPEDKIIPVWFQSDKYTTKGSEYVRTPYYTDPTFRPEVLKLLQDKDDDIWINSHSRIFRLIEKNGRWVFNGSFFKNFPNRFYWTKNLFLDSEKNLWIGAANFLALKKQGKPQNGDFEYIPEKFHSWTLPYGSDSLGQYLDFHFEWYEFTHDMGFQGHTGWIDNLYFDDKDQLFVLNENVVYGYRLSWDSANRPVFTKNYQFEKNKDDPGTFWKSNASGIYLSDEKTLISGDWPYGAIKVDLGNSSGFKKLYNVDGNQNSLPKMNYSCIHDLGEGRILIGGSNNDLYLTDKDFTSFRKLPLEINFGGSVDNMIQSIIHDGVGGLWITNFIGQMAYFSEDCVDDPKRKNGCSYQFKPDNFEGMNGRLNVVGIDIDSNRQLWIACDIGLYRFDLTSIASGIDWKNVVFKAFDKSITMADTTKVEPLRYMIPVKTDFYLMCAGDSVYQFDPLKRAYRNVICEGDLAGNNPLLGIAFYDLANDGTLWTTDFIKNSAITFNKSNSQELYTVNVKNYSAADGFPQNAYEFVTDELNNLWIYPGSSMEGIIKYQPLANTFSYYNNSNIIEEAVFGGLHGKDQYGRIYFGAIDGITVFHPDSIRLNEFIPPVRITDISIHHKSIFSEPDSQRLNNLHRLRTLTLRANENVLSIEFAALSYAHPESNHFAYFLDGFDQDTIHTTAHRRVASYSNLSPGAYNFYVTGSNNNLKWNKEGARLRITVLPPWYATVYAYFLYAVVGIGLIVWWRKYDLKRMRLEHEAELEHTEAEKLRELDRVKSQFFSNISHEFRTPLTLILGPLDEIIRHTTDSNVKGLAAIMKRNARRLLKLINQILDLSMLDAGKLKLQVTCQDLSLFIKDLTANFESAAENKHVRLSCDVPEKPLEVYFDADKLEDVLGNLIENALKFTPSGGSVRVELKHKGNHFWEDGGLSDAAEITVQDSGIGIPEAMIPKIFDRFYQVDASHSRRHEGAGIGLSLVHDLVKLHCGTIDVQSEINTGTTFIIRLRLGHRHLQTDEISNMTLEPKSAEMDILTGTFDGSIDITNENERKNEINKSALPLILVVENNADMRHYIINHMDHQFAFLEAGDGISGYETAIKTMPDLILSDLMMPGMDGYEFCAKLRSDERTRHIPIIILTAKAGRKNQIHGYDCGADDYVIKPFDQGMLVARIKNLLRERKLLAEKFSLSWANTSPGDHIPTADEKFIQRLNSILEIKYHDAEFGTMSLQKEAGFSHSVLYRKLKSLTNLSPNAYIRNYRLLKAHDLLSNQHMDISTTAYLCGFNNLSYFSKCYRQFFNRAPHEDHAISQG